MALVSLLGPSSSTLFCYRSLGFLDVTRPPLCPCRVASIRPTSKSPRLEDVRPRSFVEGFRPSGRGRSTYDWGEVSEGRGQDRNRGSRRNSLPSQISLSGPIRLLPKVEVDSPARDFYGGWE